jgi:hypothetical protein
MINKLLPAALIVIAILVIWLGYKFVDVKLMKHLPYPDIGESVEHFENKIGEKLYLTSYNTNCYHYSYWNEGDVCWIEADGNKIIISVRK